MEALTGLLYTNLHHYNSDNNQMGLLYCDQIFSLATSLTLYSERIFTVSMRYLSALVGFFSSVAAASISPCRARATAERS